MHPRWIVPVLTGVALTARTEPLHRALTDAERTAFGAPLAQITRDVMHSVPEQYQPCELERDAADLVRPDTLLEGDALTLDNVTRPDSWLVGVRCKTGTVIVRFDRVAINFDDVRMEKYTLVARSTDYLHLRQKPPERGEILYVRSAEEPKNFGLATPRTIEVRWKGMNPRDSVGAATRAARQLLGPSRFPVITP